MQTSFTAAQLADADTAAAEGVIRQCVHCGFCTATCPTYVLLGDERDSPRGRIYLMKEMLESQSRPTPQVVRHIDRCLSCLSCMTTCPSGVNYMHLVDHARAYVHERYRRPLRERLLRNLLTFVLPSPGRFRLALRLAALTRPMAPLATRLFGREVGAMLALTPPRLPRPASKPAGSPTGARGRIVMLQGCAEPVLQPEIREAAVRLLERAGYAVTFAAGEVCCGSLVHHMGREEAALTAARRNVAVWTREIERGDLAAIVVTTSGCGTTIKDYGHMLRADPAFAEKAARVSALAADVSEVLARFDLPPVVADHPSAGLRVAYHPACSLQHGQKVIEEPRRLLTEAGFRVHVPAEAHLCCGSAGTYNILQPEIAGRLRERKTAAIARLDPQVIATGNIGCMVQIRQGAKVPVVHTVELLDWATGGPRPPGLHGLPLTRSTS